MTETGNLSNRDLFDRGYHLCRSNAHLTWRSRGIAR